MLEQVVQLIQTLSPETTTKKERLDALLQMMVQSLPVTVQGMAMIYLSSVRRLLDNMSDEEVDNIICQAESLISYIKGDFADGNEHNTD